MIINRFIATALGVLATLPLAADFQLTLSDSIVRSYGADGGFPFTPSLSSSGDQAYVVYTINATSTSQVIAELFTNSNGELFSLDTILWGNDGFPIIDNGYGSPDFTRFSLVDDNNTDTIRIRLFNTALAHLDTATFNDYAPGTGSFSGNGGQWSQDGDFLLMTYLTNATPGSLTTTIRVLDSSTLNGIASTTISGGSFGGIFLQFDNRTFVAVTSYNTTTGNDWVYGFDRENAAPPSTLYVFELTGNALTLIDSASLPQAADAPSGTIFQQNNHNRALIGIGTSRAIKTGEVNIFSDNSDKTAFPDTNGHEELIYDFNGSSLNLAFSKNVNAGVQAPTFTPDGKHVFVDVQAIDGAPGFFRGYKLREEHHHRHNHPLNLDLEAETGPFISPPFFVGTVSGNGDWLLVTGSDQNSGTSQTNENSQTNNINLYRIHD